MASNFDSAILNWGPAVSDCLVWICGFRLSSIAIRPLQILSVFRPENVVSRKEKKNVTGEKRDLCDIV